MGKVDASHLRGGRKGLPKKSPSYKFDSAIAE